MRLMATHEHRSRCYREHRAARSTTGLTAGPCTIGECVPLSLQGGGGTESE